MAKSRKTKTVWVANIVLPSLDAQHTTFIEMCGPEAEKIKIWLFLGTFCKNGWNFESKIGLRYGFRSDANRCGKHDFYWDIKSVTKQS